MPIASTTRSVTPMSPDAFEPEHRILDLVQRGEVVRGFPCPIESGPPRMTLDTGDERRDRLLHRGGVFGGVLFRRPADLSADGDADARYLGGFFITAGWADMTGAVDARTVWPQ